MHARAVRRLSTVSRVLAQDAGRAAAAARPARVHLTSPIPPGSTDDIRYTERGGVRTYTLRRPRALNALSLDMFRSLAGKAYDWRVDPSVSLVIGIGEGRAFSAGGDIKSVIEAVRTNQPELAHTMTITSFGLNWRMAHIGKPYVAVIDGIVMGGGAGISLPADIRIATPRTIYASPEQRIGYSPDFGGSYYKMQLDGQIGTWLAVTGQDVYGRAVYELGLASHYVAEEDVDAIIERLAALGGTPTAAEISAVVAEYQLDPKDGAGDSSKANPDGHSIIHGAIREVLDHAFSAESLSAVLARLQHAAASHRDPAARLWAAEQVAIMATRGPTGMAVALENYHQALAARRYATSLLNDSRMATSFTSTARVTNDLLVGGIHTLYDKNKGPIAFSPPLAEVDGEDLQPETIRRRFFQPSVHNAEMPPLDLTPPPAGPGPDAMWGNFRRYGIPAEVVVRAAAQSAAQSGGSEDDMVRRVVDQSGETRRRVEFGRAVRRLLRGMAEREGSVSGA